MRPRTPLIAALLALVILAAPTMVAANWTHKGQGELTSNASFGLKGSVTLSTSAGNVACTAELGTALTGSGSSGHVSSFTVSKASECDLTGSLAAICGTSGVTKVEKTGTWAMTAEEEAIKVSEVDIHYTLGGCLIPGFRVKGSVTATPDKANAISSVNLSGSQPLYNALGESVGSGELKGTLTATPAGTYGVKTAPLVQTTWLKHEEHLTEDEELNLSGQFSVSGSLGSITCGISAKANLLSEEVEEGEPEGEIESFTVASPGACDLTGTLKTTCGTNAVTGVEKTGTWDLTATKEDVSVTGMSLDFKFASCAIPSLRFEGNATVAVDDVAEIGETTFSGSSFTTYNSAEEAIGSASVGGSQSVSPEGTFGLDLKPPCPEAEGVNWTHEGQPLDEPECAVSIELTGPFEYGLKNGSLGFHGTAEMKLTIDSDGTGSVTSFHWTECTGTGSLNGYPCTVTPTSPNWPVTTTENGTILIEIEGLHQIHYSNPAHTIPVITYQVAMDVIATPDSTEAMSMVTLEAGEGFIFNGQEGKVSGELEVVGENAGTYGFE